MYALLCLAAAEHKHHDVPTWTLAHAHHYWLPGSRRSAYKGKGEEVRDWSVTSERGRASEPNVTGSIGNPNRAGCVCLLSPLQAAITNGPLACERACEGIELAWYPSSPCTTLALGLVSSACRSSQVLACLVGWLGPG